MPNLCTLGSARVVDDSGAFIPPVCHMTVEVDTENDIREDLGEMPLAFALGITALPAAPDDSGQAEGIVLEGVGGLNACAVGGRDTRCSDVVGELDPGDTCLHSTGADAENRARVFCKNGCLALLVGNDLTMVFDRANKAVSLSAFGHAVEISDANGIMMADSTGSGWFQLKDGSATLSGSGVTIAGAVSIGNAAAQPVVLAPSLLSYLTALEALLTAMAATIDAKLVPTTVTSPAVAAFIASGAAFKTAATAVFTKAT